jgi:hypothetical protein
MPQRSAGSNLPERSQHSLPVATLADAVEHNNELIEEVLAGINAKRAVVKFGASKALRILSERVPEALYPHFDSFAAMLSHDNQILKWNATLTLANWRGWIAKERSKPSWTSTWI